MFNGRAIEYRVVVEEKATGRILATYIYDSFDRAHECQRDVKEIRIKQNHERVRVLLTEHVLSD